MRDKPVLLTGMFDMDNYGDLLFPLVARHRLAAFGRKVVPVAPSARPAGLADALPPVDITRMISDDTPIAGILVGGGYVIHAGSMQFLDHYDASAAVWCGVGLWLGATLAAALRDVPIAWNAPGVPHPFSARQHRLIGTALRATTYLSLRDHGSARLLAAPADVPVGIVPDPIADIARLWPKSALSEAWRHLLQRKGIAADARLLAIHVRNRSMAGMDPADLGARLGAFARAHGLVPALIAVGRSHDDPAVARRIAPHLGAHLLLDDPLGLREITAALAHSAVYVGASLHGYVVSAAYGVPGVLVARPAYQKFAGFLEHTGRPQDLATDWNAALRVAAERATEMPGCRIPARVFDALDRHWHAIEAAMNATRWHRDARAAFGLALLRAGIQADGPGWALRPILNRVMRGTTNHAPEEVAHG